MGGGDGGAGDGGGDASGAGESSAAPATTAAAAPAAASMPAHPAVAEEPSAPPPSPMVQAYNNRRKIPFWAMPVLAMIPVWAYVYVGTLEAPPEGPGPAALGAELYAGNGCAGCHGSTGGGGVGPAFTSGAIYETWPSFEDHFEWVRLGSNGWSAEKGDTYGANDNPVAGGMPGFAEESISDAELIYVVLHERELGGENPDTEDQVRLEVVAEYLFEHPDLTLEEAIEEAEAEGLFELAAEAGE